MRTWSLALLVMSLALPLAFGAGCDGGGDEAPDAGADAGAGAGDAGGGPFPPLVYEDPDTKLMWEDPPSPDLMDHAAAAARCNGLVLRGHSDWRLPTVGELRTLVRGCPSMEPGGACTIQEGSCLSGACQEQCYGCDANMGPADGCYWPPGLHGECSSYWSSALQEGFDDIAYDLAFERASLRGTGAHNLLGVRCLRKADGS